jgi:threonine synthase
MAILAAAVLERDETEHDKMDIAAAFGDFSVQISAWYLRKMGVPIGNIVCCCAEDNQLWELICLGQMKTDIGLPANLERLISDCGGIGEVERYRSSFTSGTNYVASDATLEQLRKYLYVSVVSGDRLEAVVPNVFSTYDYILQSESALAYCGLMDYRTKTGITRPVLVMCDYSPSCEADKISAWMNLSKEAFLKLV